MARHGAGQLGRSPRAASNAARAAGRGRRAPAGSSRSASSNAAAASWPPGRGQRLRQPEARLGVAGCEPHRLLERARRFRRLVEREQQREAQALPGERALRVEPHALAEVIRERVPVLESDQVPRELLAHAGRARSGPIPSASAARHASAPAARLSRSQRRACSRAAGVSSAGARGLGESVPGSR